MAAGDRPTNVVIVDKHTAAETPCELTWAGIDDHGNGLWLVSESTVFDPARHVIRVGMLPGRTSIAFPTNLKGGRR